MDKRASQIADLLDRLDPDTRYEFEERAGIIEFDAGIERDDAECYALVDLLRTYPAALTGMNVFQINKDQQTAFVLTTDVEATYARFDREDAKALRVADLAVVLKTMFDGIALLSHLK
jgi:hypothetical protein